jgi:hypothetical protein
VSGPLSHVVASLLRAARITIQESEMDHTSTVPFVAWVALVVSGVALLAFALGLL